MEDLKKKIKHVIDLNFDAVGINSNHLKLEMANQIIKLCHDHNKKNLENLLDFCKIVEKEENGLLFIKKMINNIID